MLFTTSLLALPLVASVANAACSGSHGSTSSHRRHHAKSSSGAFAAASVAGLAADNPKYNSQTETASWSSSIWSSSSTPASSKTSTATASASSSTSTTTTGYSLSGMSKNGIHFGFLPDDGSGGGTAGTLSELNSAMGATAATQGYYAQAQDGVTFDGSQLTDKMDDIVAAGAVAQFAVMPTGGWSGLTSSDNSQAVNICNVMKLFTDKGVEVWLRFAHEMNYYQTDGTYTGGVSDFKEGWATVAAACSSIAPEVKMFFSPNVADESQYDEYFPDDILTVDIIGIDWYPNDPSEDFVSGVQSFHDKYTGSRVKYATGETGLAQEFTIADRLTWATTLTSAATASSLPNVIACSWFNYYKGYDFRIAGVSGDNVVAAYFA